MKTEAHITNGTSGSLLDQYLVIQISDTHYAIKLEPIREIVIIPKITPIPDAPDFVRGVIKLRNNIITLIDTRKRLGNQSLEEMDREMIAMLNHHEQEHIEWLQSLYSSIEKDSEFSTKSDSHSCSFGKWYDNYRTDNIGLSVYLKQFDLPHKKIHAIAARAFNEKKMNGTEAALKMIDEVRNTDLKQLLELFGGVQNAIKESHRELAIVIEHQGDLIAISADNVSNIFNFDDSMLQQTEMKSKNKFVSGSVNNNRDIFLMLDLDRLVEY